jgi:hypothetical protein
MRSYNSSVLTKQRMKICRSITVQGSSLDGEDTKYKNDRAFSTTNVNNIERYAIVCTCKCRACICI